MTQQEMIIKYTRLVHYVAQKYNSSLKPGMLDYDDLVQEGMIGLVNAIKFHDPEKGSFKTYAYHWISGKIRVAIDDRAGTFKSRRSWVFLKKIKEELALLKQKGAYPSIRDLANHFDVSDLVIANALRQKRYSLEEADRKFLEDKKSKSVEQSLIDKENEKLVYRILTYLKPQDADLIRLRFGLGTPKQSLAAVGKKFKVSNERIRQRQKKILEKVRKHFRKDNILVT